MNSVGTQRLRDGWTSVELREVGQIVTGSTPPKAKTEYYGGGFPFVKPPELRHRPVNDSEDKLSDKGAEVADVAPVGSVLVSCIGNLGKTGIATRPVAFNQQINAIIPNDPNASKWIFYAVQTLDFASQLANVASATTIAIVNKGKFSGLRIPLAPEDEQRQIVAEIEKQFTRLEAGVAGLRRVQANLKRYRAAVLKAACEGKLVPTEACLRQAERGRQAELARQEGRTLPAPRPGVYYVYAIRCDNDSIYIGQTQDLQTRWREHLAGQAADWTSQHKPVSIVHYEEYSSREEAVAREKWLKTGFGRKWIRREIAAGRLPAEQVGARQAGYETGAQLLDRILTERRQKWNGKGKYKEPAKPDTEILPSLPEGWTWVSPAQVADFDDNAICAGPFGTIFKAKDFRPEGIPIIFLRHVAPGRYLTAKPGFMDKVKWDELFRPYSVYGGELLITKLGEPPGVCAIYPENIGPAMVTPDVIKMSVNKRIALPKYLLAYFNSELAQRFATGAAFGTTRLRLTLPIFRETPVPLPPFVEQRRIVAEVERRLSVVEELEAVVNGNLQRATRLRQSILQRAFEGKLTN